MTGRARGRPAVDAGTRAAILAAARASFAERGYDATTLRGIARTAGVDPALVHHYFDGKPALLVAALELPYDPRAVLPGVLAGDLGGLGTRIATTVLGLWEEPEVRDRLLAVLRSAFANDELAGTLRAFASEAIVEPIAARLGDPTATRAQRSCSRRCWGWPSRAICCDSSRSPRCRLTR